MNAETVKKKKQSEATEAKLFINIETLTNEVATLGASYKPPNPIAKLEAMIANFTQALTLRDALQQKDADEEEKRNARESLHAPVARLMSDLVVYCESAGWDANDLAALKTFNREYRGRRAAPKKSGEGENAGEGGATPKKNISSAQTSYAGKTEHFANFVAMLRANAANFNPEEDRFKLSTLDALVAALRAANSDVSAAATETNQARAALDALLYTNAGNLVDAATSAKKYVGSAFRTHQVNQNIKKLKFEKPKRLG
jgi:hypothetical protein